MAQYFIGIGLPPNEDKLFSLIKQHFHHNGKLSSTPHITLAPPFELEDENEFLENFISWAKKEKAFIIKVKTVDKFIQPKYGTVYLAPINDKYLQELYASLIKRFNLLSDQGSFIPHLTVAQRVPLRRLNEIEDQIRKMDLSLKLKVKQLNLYKKEVGQCWKKFAEVRLKEGRIN
ncbi:MAG: 2'-5' RNA ligase family protein [Patescibacteria group bacterium]|jgi:2'-5' RNA ligase